MNIYIPEHIGEIGIIGTMRDMLVEYSARYQEGTDSFSSWQEALRLDPVRRFLEMRIPVSSVPADEDYDSVIDYLCRLFYSVKGTPKVFEYMRRYLGLDFAEDSPKYSTLSTIKVDLITLTTDDQSLFYEALEDFLSALLYFGRLDANFGNVKLVVSDTITLYLGAGDESYRHYVVRGKEF